jgi:hypothetical protein
MDVGAALLARARAAGKSSLAVVGTSKNAGKSVVVAAVIDALARAAVPYGLCSIGRDGESADALDGASKPRFFLRAGATFATAVALVPRSPAVEIIALTRERSALGNIALARMRAPGFVEVAGPPSAAALRRIVHLLGAAAPFVVIDGAVDRVAALRGGEDAIVVAVGAATATTLGRAVDEVAALAARLRLPAFDARADALAISGALTANEAAEFARAGERRQIVVDDPTQVAFGGRAFLALAAKLDLRCRRPLHPVACSVAPIGFERGFEPVTFAAAVARATGLPTYDAYAGTVAEVAAA